MFRVVKSIFSPIICRYNYKIGDVFRELMGCRVSGSVVGAGSTAVGTVSGASTLMSTGEFTQNNRNKGQCTIL